MSRKWAVIITDQDLKLKRVAIVEVEGNFMVWENAKTAAELEDSECALMLVGPVSKSARKYSYF